MISTIVDIGQLKKLQIVVQIKTSSQFLIRLIYYFLGKKTKGEAQWVEITNNVSSKELPLYNLQDTYEIKHFTKQNQQNNYGCESNTEIGVGSLTFSSNGETSIPYSEYMSILEFAFDCKRDDIIYFIEIFATGKHVTDLSLSRKIRKPSEVLKIITSADFCVIVYSNGSVEFVQIKTSQQFYKKCSAKDDIIFEAAIHLENGDSIIKILLMKHNYSSSNNINQHCPNLDSNKSEISMEKQDNDKTSISQNSVTKNMEDTKHVMHRVHLRRNHKVRTTAKVSIPKIYFSHVDRHHEMRYYMEDALEQVKSFNLFPQTPSFDSHIVWPSGHVILPYKVRFITESSHDNGYMERLRSFILEENERKKNWSDNRIVRPEPLVNAGFSYEGNEDEVVCKACGCKSQIDQWSDDDEEYAEFVHRRENPKCVFLTNKPSSLKSSHLHQRGFSGNENEGYNGPVRFNNDCATYWVQSNCRQESLLKSNVNQSVHHNQAFSKCIKDEINSVAKGNTFIPYDSIHSDGIHLIY